MELAYPVADNPVHSVPGRVPVHPADSAVQHLPETGSIRTNADGVLDRVQVDLVEYEGLHAQHANRPHRQSPATNPRPIGGGPPETPTAAGVALTR